MSHNRLHENVTSTLYAVFGALTGQGIAQWTGLLRGAVFSIIVSAVSAIVGYVVVHYTKKLIARLEGNREPKPPNTD